MRSTYFICDTLRRVGKTCIDYWNQFLGKIIYYPIPEKEPPDTIRSRYSKDNARKILLLLGIMDASSKDSVVPNIDPSGESMLKMNMRESRGKYGKLKICTFSDFELHPVRSVFKSLPSELLNKDDTNQAHNFGHWLL